MNSAQEKTLKMQKIMKEKKIDALIVLNYIDMLYFCGTMHGNLLLILQDEAPHLFNRRAFERASAEIENGKVVAFKSFKEIKEYLPQNAQVAFIFDATPVDLFEKTVKDLNLNRDQIVDFSSSLKYLKMIKNKDEINRIKKAGEIVAKSYLQLAKIIKPGLSEKDIAIELEYLMKKNGHLGENRFRGYNQIELLTYVITGENIYTPTIHATPYGGSGASKHIGVGSSLKKVENGKPIMIDTVGNFEGYHNDTTRSFMIGKPSSVITEAYNQLLEIYDFLKSLLKPGALCEDIYNQTIEKVKQMGLENHFMGLKNTRVPFIGHGIGIQVDEFPVIANRFKVALEPGMTLALEPKLFFKDFGGVGIENTFAITDKGCERLCSLNNEIIICE